LATNLEDVPVHEGGCLCGAVRYRVVGEPIAVSICHCINCQRNTGSAFSVNAIFGEGALTYQGSPSVYDDIGDTGHVVRRVFCGTCGTPIESQSVYSVPNYVVVKTGTFDDPAHFVPDNEVYCVSALEWVTESADRPRYERTNFDAVGDADV
jgi:hypothetical protein